LTEHLIDERHRGVANEYPASISVIDYVQQNLAEDSPSSLETILAEYAARADSSPACRKALVAFRFYFHEESLVDRHRLARTYQSTLDAVGVGELVVARAWARACCLLLKGTLNAAALDLHTEEGADSGDGGFRRGDHLLIAQQVALLRAMVAPLQGSPSVLDPILHQGCDKILWRP
jgi:hypothetical protein